MSAIAETAPPPTGRARRRYRYGLTLARVWLGVFGVGCAIVLFMAREERRRPREDSDATLRAEVSAPSCVASGREAIRAGMSPAEVIWVLPDCIGGNGKTKLLYFWFGRLFDGPKVSPSMVSRWRSQSDRDAIASLAEQPTVHALLDAIDADRTRLGAVELLELELGSGYSFTVYFDADGHVIEVGDLDGSSEPTSTR